MDFPAKVLTVQGKTATQTRSATFKTAELLVGWQGWNMGFSVSKAVLFSLLLSPFPAHLYFNHLTFCSSGCVLSVALFSDSPTLSSVAFDLLLSPLSTGTGQPRLQGGGCHCTAIGAMGRASQPGLLAPVCPLLPFL